jgi:dienelactone hydrolase
MKVVREEPANLAEHTVFRPADLPAGPLPIVAFANGGCRNTPIEFTAFLTELASHGYVIIAAGTNDVEFAISDYQKIMPNGKPVQRVVPSVLTDAVDWAQRESTRSGNPYFGKLDSTKVAFMGQSCGGLQAIAASLDPRTTTTVVLNSFAAGASLTPIANASLPPRVSLDELSKPVAYFIGGPQDTAYQRADSNFADVKTLPVFNANLPVGHTGAYPAPDLRWSNAVLAWLDWRLKGNAEAGRQFKGAKCGLCTDPAWTVKSKNIDALTP